MKPMIEILDDIDDSRPMGKGELAARLYGDAYCDSHRRHLLATYITSPHLDAPLRKLGLTPRAKLLQPQHLHLILTAIRKSITHT